VRPTFRKAGNKTEKNKKTEKMAGHHAEKQTKFCGKFVHSQLIE
jgi:hypothetical protein